MFNLSHFFWQLNAQRDLYFRENPSSSLRGSSSGGNSVLTSNSLAKDLYLSRGGDSMSISRESKSKPLYTKDSDAVVGFSDLPNQIHRRTVKKGFEFTLMVVGKLVC